MIGYQFKKSQIASILFMYLFIPFTPSVALESKDYLLIETLLKNCYVNTESCNQALIKINNYQKNAAMNKRFSCQTRLLGLEANLIMAINSNYKRKEAKNIIQAVKEFC